MGKFIQATPTLKGKDAEHFLKEILKEQNKPSKARIMLLNDAEKVKFNLS